MFSPALVRYIVDPDNSLKEETSKMSIERHVLRHSVLDYEKVKKDYGFFGEVLSKIKQLFKNGKKSELKNQE